MGYTFGVGREAPKFSLEAVGGGTLQLADYRGEWAPVIVFFAQGEPLAMDRLSALSHVADKFWGVRAQLLGVTMASKDDVPGLQERVRRLAFPVLVDEQGAVARAYGAWDAASERVLPVTCIVDKAGKIVWSKEGAAARDPQGLLNAFRDVVR